MQPSMPAPAPTKVTPGLSSAQLHHLLTNTFIATHSAASFNWVLEQEINGEIFQQLTVELLQEHVPSLGL